MAVLESKSSWPKEKGKSRLPRLKLEIVGLETFPRIRNDRNSEDKQDRLAVGQRLRRCTLKAKRVRCRQFKKKIVGSAGYRFVKVAVITIDL